MKIADLQKKINDQRAELSKLAFVKDKHGDSTEQLRIKGLGKRPLFTTILISKDGKHSEKFYSYENKLYDGTGMPIKDLKPGDIEKIQAREISMKREFKCEVPDCGKIFDTEAKLKGHTASVHKSKG